MIARIGGAAGFSSRRSAPSRDEVRKVGARFGKRTVATIAPPRARGWRSVHEHTGRTTDRARAPRAEPRAHPDTEGYVERDGVRTFYEAYGDGEPTVLLLPTWSILHSRCWKMQIAYLARHCRVVAFDGRGNGKSDRPAEPGAYVEQQFADDALAVMDATGIDRAVLVSLSRGAERSLLLAAGHPERVAGMVFIAPALPLPPTAPRAAAEQEFQERRESYRGWEKWNGNYWLENYEDFLEFFFSQVFTEPHSTKHRETPLPGRSKPTPRRWLRPSSRRGFPTRQPSAG
jgi:pimeloyl-ACP methyl ester carboxylesterase